MSDTHAKVATAKLHILGGFHLVNCDGASINLAANKARLLLAFLSIPAGTTHTREKLAALLWGDRGEDQARASLRTSLSEIRRALGKDALADKNGAIGLRQGFLTTDYDVLISLDNPEAVFNEFSDIYPGEFLAGYENDSEEFLVWLRMMRTASKDAAMRICEAAATRFNARGETARAIELMRSSLSIEPLRETTHRTIMELYAANGEKAMALAQFRTCRELLMHELDAKPDEQTQELADRISQRDGELSASLLSQVRSHDLAPAAPTSRTRAEEGDRPSIAILPFVNMSGDAEQNFFVEGIVEDITTDLALISGIHVAARGATLMLRGSTDKPSAKAAEVGVRFVVEGSIRKFGDAIRISAQLVDAETDRLVWAERFDRKLENIFELQSEIASAIVGALRANLSLPSHSGSAARTTSNADAYQSYLRGRAMLRDLSQHSLGTALKLFEHAISLDPNYAQAYASLGLGHVLKVMHYGGNKTDLDLSLENTATALEINAQLADAYVARGHTFTQLKQSEEAERNFDIAISLSPNSPDGHFYNGLMQMSLKNDQEKALEELQIAFDMDDQDLQTGMMLNLCLHALNRTDDVRKLSKHMLATATRRLANNAHDLSATYIMASSLFHLGRLDEARQWMQATAAFGLDDARTAYNLACLASQLGDIENALNYLEKMLEIGCSAGKLYWIKNSDPDLVKLRKDDRFEALLLKFGHLVT